MLLQRSTRGFYLPLLPGLRGHCREQIGVSTSGGMLAWMGGTRKHKGQKRAPCGRKGRTALLVASGSRGAIMADSGTATVATGQPLHQPSSPATSFHKPGGMDLQCINHTPLSDGRVFGWKCGTAAQVNPTKLMENANSHTLSHVCTATAVSKQYAEKNGANYKSLAHRRSADCLPQPTTSCLLEVGAADSEPLVQHAPDIDTNGPVCMMPYMNATAKPGNMPPSSLSADLATIDVSLWVP